MLKKIYQIVLCLLFLTTSVILYSNPREFLVLEALGMNNEPQTWPGFFASFQGVIGGLDVYEKNHYAGCKVAFKWGLYLDPQVGSDWWNYYFEPIKVGSRKNAKTRRLSNGIRHELAFNAISSISRQRAFELIQRYVHIKAPIQEKIDLFVHENFIDKFIIGVHYRGTDKSIEAPRVPYQKVHDELDKIITNLGKDINYLIFVATDEQNFIDYIRLQYPLRVCCLDAIRSQDGKPIHFNQSNPYRKGEEALIDCILLSKTHILVRTHSNVSASAGNFNPICR